MPTIQRDSKEQYWRAHVSVWRSSGQSAAAYCQARGLSPASLGYWSRKLAQAQQSPPRLMPIEIATPVQAATPASLAPPQPTPSPQSQPGTDLDATVQVHFASGTVLHLPARAELLSLLLPSLVRELATC